MSSNVRADLKLFGAGNLTTLGLSTAILAVLLVLILPVSAQLVDFGLSLSFAFSLVIFVTVIMVDEPSSFDAFPSFLLTSLVLRMALNVSSTKLIISSGHEGVSAAGSVIGGFSNLIMGESFLVGIVTFIVILIVNFFVITKGAARMAEVGARFALDGMPGRQLAIDADVSAGAITHEEATALRAKNQVEANFLGSLDGVSKFIKGDALAGMLIILVNLVVGVSNGILEHGLAFSEAISLYSKLTVGDGLVSQVPAVIVSVSAALLLAKGGNKAPISRMMTSQIERFPAALLGATAILLLLAFFPGLPVAPFGFAALLCGALLFFLSRKSVDESVDREIESEIEDEAVSLTYGDMLSVDEIHVEFSPELVSLVLDAGSGLDARISNIRKHVASVYGVIVPEIRLSDNPALRAKSYAIEIQGVQYASGEVEPDLMMALREDTGAESGKSDKVFDPVYGAPAEWITQEQADNLASGRKTVVSPIEVIATHLMKTIVDNLEHLFTYRSLNTLLDEYVNLSSVARSAENKKFLQDVIPDRVSRETLFQILKLLVDEKVSIKNISLILEAIMEGQKFSPVPESLVEHVRRRLGFQIVSSLKGDEPILRVAQLDAEWENIFARYQVNADANAPDVALPQQNFLTLIEGLASVAQKATDAGISVALVTSARRRRFLLKLVQAKRLDLPILSFEEIGSNSDIVLYDTVAA